MALYFTRRSYNAQKKTFTDNMARITRYVELGDDNTGRSLKRTDWLDLVRAQMSQPEVTIYIHGFNTPQTVMLERLRKFERGLPKHGYRGAILAFDWPSDGIVWSYDKDKNNAQKAAPHLITDVILPLLALTPTPKINIIAHSMGAHLTLCALSHFGDAATPGSGSWKLNEAMFASGDEDEAAFEKGAWGSLLLARRFKRFTNYYSRADVVLVPAKIGDHFRDRVGRVGMPALVENSHVDVSQQENDGMGEDGRPVGIIETHNWWFDSDLWMQDVALTLGGANATIMPTRRTSQSGARVLMT